MDKLATKGVGGFPLVLNDLRQFFGRLDSPSEGIYQAFNNILRGYGDNFIVQGVILSGGTGAFSITEGWVLLDGELVKVDAQTFDEATDNRFVKVTTFDSRGTKTFLNGSINETYEKNRAVVQGTSGNLPVIFPDRFAELNIAETISASLIFSTTSIKKKIIEIGDWNMFVTVSVDIPHSLFEFKKARVTSVSIINDTETDIIDLGFVQSGASLAQGASVRATIVRLVREANGVFDNTGYNATSFNRGHITLEYEV